MMIEIRAISAEVSTQGQPVAQEYLSGLVTVPYLEYKENVL